jgi:hypothetical protein
LRRYLLPPVRLGLLPKNRAAHFVSSCTVSMASSSSSSPPSSRSSPANRNRIKTQTPSSPKTEKKKLFFETHARRKLFCPRLRKFFSHFLSFLPSFFLSFYTNSHDHLKTVAISLGWKHQSMAVCTERVPPDAHTITLQPTLDYSECGVCSWRHTRW